jgi:GNAT superfamily N-acetyltransferase
MSVPDGPFRLRSMTQGDVAEGVRLLAELGYELDAEEMALRIDAVTATPNHSLMVAEMAGRVVGLLHVFARPALENPREAVVQAIVQAIVVELTHRRSGVGKALMAEAERWGGERDCRSVMLSSNAVRTPAHAFYAALGYRTAATSYILRPRLPHR